ncbi:probable ras GTPase-activating protein-binding protein 2 at N-terminal half [Coccomyxa sp. Obi]|nr:probable ras GTPase-activating protein-binding protein 2 at N-terminal half [Coccomyxa sp. Obi]
MAAINQSVPPQHPSNVASGHASGIYATPAHAVGSQFVQQYYTVLHSSPRYLHRFYTDLSSMTHSDGGYPGQPPCIFTVQNQKDIHEKVLELNFEEAVTEIWSVDSQFSTGDGVIVQVTGSLQCKGKPQRNFVQTFFLAVQEKGYYVLNDIFRYLRTTPQAVPAPAAPISTPMPVPTLVPAPTPLENGYTNAPPPQQTFAMDTRPAATAPAAPVPTQIPHMPPPAASSAPAPAPIAQPTAPSAAPAPAPASASTPIPVQPAHTPEPVHEQQAAPPAPVPEPVPEPEEPTEDTWPTPEPEQAPEPEPEQQPQEEAPPPQPAAPSVPLTYAQRLMVNTNKQPTPAPSARPQPSAAAVVPAAAPAPVQAAPEAKPTAPAPYNGIPNGNHPTENGYYSRDEQPGTSVFVRNLPQDVTEEKLEAAFKELGALRGPKPVNLKIQKGKESFAFVDFEDSAAQQAAITGPVIIDGHQVTVVEKKPQFIKSRGRGPGPTRGSFRGGRGDGRSGRGDGGRAGPGSARFLERNASISSERSESARGGRRGGRGGRDGAPSSAGRAPRGRGEGRGERPAPAVAAA